MAANLIERVARALSYSGGDDPDVLVYPIKTLPVTHDGHPMMRADTPLIPHWQTKTGLATVVLEVTKQEFTKIAADPGFIQARDTEWDEGVEYAKSFIAQAILRAT